MKEYKGMRMFTPEEHTTLEKILQGWVTAAHEYGFLQYKTPLLDPIELYQNKTSEEILNEQTYAFTDRGGRHIVLRPEITPGVSMMIASLQKNKNLPIPYKVFSIGSVFRYEKPQHGRTREHIQCNMDIFGEKGVWADAEIVEVAFAAIQHIGLKKKDFVVRINDRDHLEQTLLSTGIQKKMLPALLRLLDQRMKISSTVFKKKLKEITSVSVQDIDSALTDVPENIKHIQNLLASKDIEIVYDPGIIRGFDYYTGFIFEVYAKDASVTRSVLGGGRYDSLTSSYGDTAIPAVGFGMGDVILSLLLNQSSVPSISNTIIASVATEDDLPHMYRTCQKIRAFKPITFLGITPTKKKAISLFKRAEREGVPFVIIFDGTVYTVRNILKRKDISCATEKELIEYIKKLKLNII